MNENFEERETQGKFYSDLIIDIKFVGNLLILLSDYSQGKGDVAAAKWWSEERKSRGNLSLTIFRNDLYCGGLLWNRMPILQPPWRGHKGLGSSVTVPPPPAFDIIPERRPVRDELLPAGKIFWLNGTATRDNNNFASLRVTRFTPPSARYGRERWTLLMSPSDRWMDRDSRITRPHRHSRFSRIRFACFWAKGEHFRVR